MSNEIQNTTIDTTEDVDVTTPVDIDTPATEPAPAPETDANEPTGNREARYRRQLRDTEAERDALISRLETLQRTQAESLAELDKPAALWATGATVADLLDDSGNIDAEKVAIVAQMAHEQFGASRPVRAPRPNPGQGYGGPVSTKADTWTDAFKQ